VVYVSESLSLATLEVLAHAESVSMLNQYVALKVTFPSDSLTVLTSDELPDVWQSNPAPDSTRHLGNSWFNLQETLALKVPSTLIPNEHNFLLNPAHPGFGRIDVAAPIPFPFDSRILKVVADQPD
jgi:RES domain-containing protein